MSLSNIIQVNNVGEPPATKVNCESVRCSETIKAKNFLAAGVGSESTFFGKLNVFDLAHFYNDVIIDGTVTLDHVDVNTITCMDATITHNLDVENNLNVTHNITATGDLFCHNANIGNDLSVTHNISCVDLTCDNATVHNDLEVQNNLNVLQTSQLNQVYAQNENVEYDYVNKHLVVPRLSTGDRDSVGAEDGCLLFNTDLQNMQGYYSGKWRNIGCWPYQTFYYLPDTEIVTNGTAYKIGSTNVWKTLYNTDEEEYIANAGDGNFKIFKSGYYYYNIEITLEGPVPDYHFLAIYLSAVLDDTDCVNYSGFKRTASPTQYPDKENRMNLTGTTYIDGGRRLSFFLYQQNDTGDIFRIRNSSSNPSPFSYNFINQCQINLLSPAF